MGAQAVVLAGAIENLGNFWTTTLLHWLGAGLLIVLLFLVLREALRKASIKAALGSVIILVACWAVYTHRDSLSNMFGTEMVDHPGATVPVQGAPRMPAELSPVFTGQL